MGDEARESIRSIRIEDEMRTSYLDYAMSVIVSRALPDARDGLKPSQPDDFLVQSQAQLLKLITTITNGIAIGAAFSASLAASAA